MPSSSVACLPHLHLLRDLLPLLNQLSLKTAMLNLGAEAAVDTDAQPYNPSNLRNIPLRGCTGNVQRA